MSRTSLSALAKKSLLVAIVVGAGAPFNHAAPTWRVGQLSARSVARGFAESLATDALRPAERTFLEKAAALSRDELQLARIALSQASSSEVRSFAQQLVGDHQLISEAVDALQRRKATGSEPAREPEATPKSDVRTKVAQKSGAEFDRAFLRAIAEMHAETMALFEQTVAGAKDTDVRELVGSYLPTLREHQNKIIELRKALD